MKDTSKLTFGDIPGPDWKESLTTDTTIDFTLWDRIQILFGCDLNVHMKTLCETLAGNVARLRAEASLVAAQARLAVCRRIASEKTTPGLAGSLKNSVWLLTQKAFLYRRSEFTFQRGGA